VTEDSGSQKAGPQSDVSPDEDHRDRLIWWSLVAVGVVIFIGVVLLGRPLVEGRLVAARNLDKAAAILKETDGSMTALDRAVRSSVTTSTPQGAEDALAIVWATRVKLQEASSLSQTGYERLTTDEQKRAVLLKATATSRLAALIPAETVLSNGGAVRDQAMQEYERALEKVRSADASLEKL
jgi:hypothetical protein